MKLRAFILISLIMLFVLPVSLVVAQQPHEHFPSDPEFTIEMKNGVDEMYYIDQTSLSIGVVVYNKQDIPDEAVVGIRYDLLRGPGTYVSRNRSSGFISAHGDIDVYFDIELEEPLDTSGGFAYSIQLLVMNETNRIQDTAYLTLINRGNHDFEVSKPSISGYGGDLVENNPVEIDIRVTNRGTGTYPFLAIAYADGEEIGENMGYGLANGSEDVKIVWEKPKEGHYEIVVDVYAVEGWDIETNDYILGNEPAESPGVSVRIEEEGDDLALLLWILAISFVLIAVLSFLVYRRRKKRS